jgi:hypothetical protein
MRMKSPNELRAALRAAERELDAATRRTDLNAAAKKFMQVKAALKAAEKAAAGATRCAPSRAAEGAALS